MELHADGTFLRAVATIPAGTILERAERNPQLRGLSDRPVEYQPTRYITHANNIYIYTQGVGRILLKTGKNKGKACRKIELGSEVEHRVKKVELVFQYEK